MGKLMAVEILLLPPQCTDIMQPLDKAVFRSLNIEFSQSKHYWAPEHRSHLAKHANYVHMFCQASCVP